MVHIVDTDWAGRSRVLTRVPHRGRRDYSQPVRRDAELWKVKPSQEPVEVTRVFPAIRAGGVVGFVFFGWPVEAEKIAGRYAACFWLGSVRGGRWNGQMRHGPVNDVGVFLGVVRAGVGGFRRGFREWSGGGIHWAAALEDCLLVFRGRLWWDGTKKASVLLYGKVRRRHFGSTGDGEGDEFKIGTRDGKGNFARGSCRSVRESETYVGRLDL